ncbi:uncharacterized protein LOC117226935 isoform X5 [Megalopta genalis]|uniref:uncharacterized protein LOC117226935 isoform X5 n=1 Tax=Megalopta genalis TaxID=115081 RepID=UPI003FD3ABA3
MASPSAINKTMKFCLHFVGIWPGTPFPDVHKFFWIVTMILLQTYQYDYIISHYKTERLAIVIDSLTIAIPFSLVCFKLIAIWTNQSVLREILTTMKEDCEKYAVTDTDNLIAKTSVLSFRLTTAILAAHITCSTLYIIGVLGYQQGNSTTRELLFRMDLPFDTNVSPAYELVVTEQILHLLSSSLTFSTFGSLLLTMSVGLENVVPVFLKCIMFYNVMCLDAFTYCFVGEFLEIKSNMIAETAYGIPWYDLDPNVSRQVVLLILRAHNGLPLTFGKFSKLSLESFTAMMKASASYMSVLLAMS